MNEAEIKRNSADLALQWVWSNPEVSLALSGMGLMNQVIENIDRASHSPDRLTEIELQLITNIREITRSCLKQA
ncbi:hypothetical protein MUP77_11525 [Candidatus Bathyarchaeota archaeon]|nr:hypothetical protein [Candidatus Bathyarchaeota archaeon]